MRSTWYFSGSQTPILIFASMFGVFMSSHFPIYASKIRLTSGKISGSGAIIPVGF